jgi:hypothetical protein
MGDELGDTTAHAAGSDRRQFLRRAAVVGASTFVAPIILTVEPAGAQQITSPPPEPPSPPTEVGGSTVSRSPEPAPAPRTQVAGRTTLPRTGAELDDLVMAGLAATAGGAALVLWSADVDPGTRS